MIKDRNLRSLPLSSDKHDYKWWIPITFAAAGGNFNDTFNKIWMNDNEKTKIITNLPTKEEAVIFNIQQTGDVVNCIYTA